MFSLEINIVHTIGRGSLSLCQTVQSPVCQTQSTNNSFDIAICMSHMNLIPELFLPVGCVFIFTTLWLSFNSRTHLGAAGR